METEYINNLGVKTEVLKAKVKYVLYARKSTESDEKQALSIESQVKEMLAIADRDNLEIIDIRRESHSAKESGQRPVFKEVLEDIRRGRYTGILTWAPDRLSRNAGDLGSVVDLMDENKLIEIRTYGQHFKNSPNEKFLLMILCSQAKLENDNKSINVKRGLRTRCEMGLRPGPPLFGYLNTKHADKKCQVIIDPERGHIVKQMFEKVAYEKWSGRKIFHWLKFELNLKTRNGNKGLTLGNIYLILQNSFYYGVFEYPVKSGNFYTGKHEPLITKELFDLVQSQIKSQVLRTQEPKEFAFTKMMTCGLCGSGISADEKFKKLKDGSVNRHIYYGCTRSKDKNCKCGYINEIELIQQFEKLIEQVNINEIGMKEKIKYEVERIKRFNQSVLNTKQQIQIKDVDIRDYAKFILKDGLIEEKRELLTCFKSKILLKNKIVTIS
jgi:DNA invertase Pin-like site-specific DNA recombinase